MFKKVILALCLTSAAGLAFRMPQADMLKKDTNLDIVFENNKKWVAEMTAEDPEIFSKFQAGQNPSILWIGCSDSRIPVDKLMGLDIGDIFVIRNVANQVISHDLSMMSVIQFAITALKIPHIIVCGHYECGGIKASTENVDHAPPLELWLRKIRDTYRLHRFELDAIEDPASRQRRLVEINVIESCIELYKTGVIQSVREGNAGVTDTDYLPPKIHACVYDPTTGYLEKLPVDFNRIQENLDPIYKMYEHTGGKSSSAAAPSGEKEKGGFLSFFK
uniref:Carbonic anhydrase n=1 Tax=Aureoumbra lagunensis TaxID=44058 RepID=A0A7S3NGR7_9STRA